MEFKDKFIAFLDILGWKEMVKAAEAGTGMTLNNLIDVLKDLGTAEARKTYEKHGPMICPQSRYCQRDLDFQMTRVSDSVVVSSEISPAGLINLVSHCWGAVLRLLAKGIMCRGYITRGSIYHTDEELIGTGYQEAYKRQDQVTAFRRDADERGTPFVEIDQLVCEFVRDHGDSCVKEMFSRFIKTDGAVTALYPFQRLSHSFIIAGFGVAFDANKEKLENEKMRQTIKDFRGKIMKHVDRANPSALKKAEHYVAGLDAQLEECDEADKMIDMLDSPFPPRWKK